MHALALCSLFFVPLFNIPRVILPPFLVHRRLLRLPFNFGQDMASYSVADPGSCAFLTPGSGMGKKSGSESGIRIWDEQPGSYSENLKNNFSG